MIDTIRELSKRDNEWRKIALKLCMDKMLADDLVQDMYLRIYKQQKDWEEIKDNQAFYVYICLRNLYFNHIKKENQRDIVRIDSTKEIPFHEEYDLKEFSRMLQTEMMNLSFSQRESLELNVVDGKSMRWIASSRDISLNDVFKLCKTARDLVQGNFRKYYEEFKN